MSMQDPVSDMLTVIRNAQMRGIKKVTVPYSGLKKGILDVLVDEGYIEQYEELSSDNKKDLAVNLKYYEGKPVIEKIKRVSRPSLRIYKGYKDITPVRGGLGISIVSTPQGVMADKTARAQHVGGEIVCTVE